MLERTLKARALVAALLCAGMVKAGTGWKIEARMNHPDGVYAPGETGTLAVRVLRDGNLDTNLWVEVGFAENDVFKRAIFVPQTNATGWTEIAFTLDKPGWVSWGGMAKLPDHRTFAVTERTRDGRTYRKDVLIRGGALFGVERLRPGAPEPADFDAFWANERRKLAAVDPKVKFAPDPTDKNGRRWWFEAEIGGGWRPARACVYVPRGFRTPATAGRKYPVTLFFHGVGVSRPDDKCQPMPWNAYWKIRDDMLCVNLDPHGLPRDKPDAWYRDLWKKGTNGVPRELTSYFTHHCDDPARYYMKGVFLRIMRTIEQMCALPEWNGRDVLVRGSSQGGAQALAAAGLDQRVNWVHAVVPAMCDFAGTVDGRAGGWPQPYKRLANGSYVLPADKRDPVARRVDADVVRRLGYFDAANFVRRMNPAADVLMEAGGYDGVCPPDGVAAVYNVCAATNRVFVFGPEGGHCQGLWTPDDYLHPAVWRNGVRDKAFLFRDKVTDKRYSVQAPTCEHVAYGAHPKQFMHVWLPAKTAAKTPVLLWIHGGSWTDLGTMDRLVGANINRLKSQGVAVAVMEYRFIQEAGKAGIHPPVKAPLDDAVAALDFLRTKADAWNLDTDRIALGGGSAGACSALYAALTDGNRRGVKAVLALIPQTSLDPRETRAWIPNATYGAHAFGCGDFASWLAKRDELLPWIERFSPAALVTKVPKGKLPRMFFHCRDWIPEGRPEPDPTHALAFVRQFSKIAQQAGATCGTRYGLASCNDSFADTVDCLFEEQREVARLAAWDLTLEANDATPAKKPSCVARPQGVPEEYRTPACLRLVWKQVGDGTRTWPVRVELEQRRSQGALTVAGRIENGTRDLRVSRFAGPRFAGETVVGAPTLHVAHGLGSRITQMPDARGNYNRRVWVDRGGGVYECDSAWRSDVNVYWYPGPCRTMPFLALEGRDETTYFGCHDPRFDGKDVKALYDANDSTFTFCVEHQCTVPPGERWTLPPVVREKLAGDWHAASRRYRRWSDTVFTPMKTPPGSSRDITGWMLVILKQQNGEIIWPYTDFDQLADTVVAHGLEGVGLFGWTAYGHDNRYPDYFPDPAMGGRDALVRGIAALHARGLKVFTYANGQLMDRDATEYWRTTGRHQALLRRDGTPYCETWRKYRNAPAHAFDIACLTSEAWYERMLAQARQAAELGADGILYDQLASVQSRRCYATNHAHAVGMAVQSGERVTFIRRIRDAMQKVKPGFQVLTEGFADCELDAIAFFHGCEPGVYSAEAWLKSVAAPVGTQGCVFPEFARYTFPELVTTTRTPTPRTTRTMVNFATLLGFRHDVEVRYAPDRRYVTTGRMPAAAEYGTVLSRPDLGERGETVSPKEAQAYLKSVCAFARRNAKYLLNGTFVDTDGFVCTGAGVQAKGYRAADGSLGVLVWNTDPKAAAHFAVSCSGTFVTATEPGREAAVPSGSPLPSDSLRLLVYKGF